MRPASTADGDRERATTRALVRRVRTWSLWSLPPLQISLILAIDLAVAALVGVSWLTSPAPSGADWARWLLLAALAIGYAETSRIGSLRRYLSAAHGPMSGLAAVWALPAALVLPPSLAAGLTLVITSHVAVRTTRTVSPRAHRAVCGPATGMLATLAASSVGSTVGAQGELWSLRWPAWTPFGVLCAMLAYILTSAGLATAFGCMSPRPAPILTLLPSRDDIALECAALVLGVLVAGTLIKTPWLTPAVTVVLMPLQRSTLVTALTEAATRDSKTGLLNAAAWEQRVSIELRRAERDHTSAALLITDLDHFKRINDTLGHLGGDDALRTVATVLTGELRCHDLITRYGGDEFAVYLPAIDQPAATAAAERVRARIARARRTYTLTASVGVAYYPQHGCTTADLFTVADAALYEAKRAGRNRVAVGALRQPSHPVSADSSKDGLARIRSG
jgi:diguanylate cyclase (GGDEF)-like protein